MTTALMLFVLMTAQGRVPLLPPPGAAREAFLWPGGRNRILRGRRDKTRNPGRYMVPHGIMLWKKRWVQRQNLSLVRQQRRSVTQRRRGLSAHYEGFHAYHEGFRAHPKDFHRGRRNQ